MKSFVSALGFLTILPVPRNLASNLSTCSVYFALVGALVGSFYAGAGYAVVMAGISAEWGSLIVVMTTVVVTRGLHMDGLADMADGFWGGTEKEKILRIMKDSTNGTFGILVLIFIILVKWIALKNIVINGVFWVIIPCVMISRFTMTLLAGLYDYARNEGTGYSIISNTAWQHILVSFSYTAVFLPVFFGYGTLSVLISGILISLFIGYISRKKIGGITGDILGASGEIAEGLLLAVTPSLISLLPGFMWKSPFFNNPLMQ